jgi:rod shape-determining protein MreD
MDDVPLRPLMRTLLMIGAAVAALGLMLSPIRPGATGGVMPDLVTCLVILWVLRRPAQAGLLVIFGLGLLADLMLGRPAGLGALSLLLIGEILRGQVNVLRDLHFVFEWVVVMILLLCATLLQSMLLWVTLAPTPGLGSMIVATLATILAYPLVAVLARYGLGLRYPKRRFMVTPLGEEQVQ